MKRIPFILLALWALSQTISAATLHVGLGQPIQSLTAAADLANPGDTILIHEGAYMGGLFINNLQGTSDAWIYILAAPGETVLWEGGNNAWQFTDAAYLYISGFTFMQQTGNGLNFDDGGTYSTPAHHIIFDNCFFRDINATGNNDLLKLSGLDSFEIRNCRFLNGAEGGSGIDMVGCHDGLIIDCRFEFMGSNAIQAKGGTRNIRIERNFFKNAGERAVNLGGSTGLGFFRPINADYEAADLKVYSNIFIGSVAPVAFVGCINSEVINNTIYLPEKWVLRILQETVDTTRFAPCGNNTFRNNIIYIDDQVTVECNIGPDTAPETFTFSDNLWYHINDPSWDGPELPVTDVDQIINQDPLCDFANEDFSIPAVSPAVGEGFVVAEPILDYLGNPFLIQRSIGAVEGGVITSTEDVKVENEISIIAFPNPFTDKLNIQLLSRTAGHLKVELISADGKLNYSFAFPDPQSESIEIPVRDVSPGKYWIHVFNRNGNSKTIGIVKI